MFVLRVRHNSGVQISNFSDSGFFTPLQANFICFQIKLATFPDNIYLLKTSVLPRYKSSCMSIDEKCCAIFELRNWDRRDNFKRNRIVDLADICNLSRINIELCWANVNHFKLEGSTAVHLDK